MIIDIPRSIELDWRAAPATGANDVGRTFWIDGLQQADLPSIENDTRRPDSASNWERSPGLNITYRSLLYLY